MVVICLQNKRDGDGNGDWEHSPALDVVGWRVYVHVMSVFIILNLVSFGVNTKPINRIFLSIYDIFIRFLKSILLRRLLLIFSHSGSRIARDQWLYFFFTSHTYWHEYKGICSAEATDILTEKLCFL